MADDTLTPIGRHWARMQGVGWRRVLIVLVSVHLLAAACSETTHASGASHALVRSVAVHAAPRSTHVPIVTVETSRPTTITVTATSGNHVVKTPPSGAGETHEVPILGLRTDRDYKLLITADSNDKVHERSNATAHYKTPPLPRDFPPLKVTTDANRVSPGIILIPLYQPGPDVPEANGNESNVAAGRVIGVDETGEVVWYYKTKLQVLAVTPTSRGTLILGMDDLNVHNLDSSVREIDMLGNTVAEWSTKLAERSGKALTHEPGDSATRISLNIDSVHHDIHELPNGNIIALSTELIEVGGEKGRELCPNNPVDYVVGDVVVEFERGGRVVGTWPVSTVFDPTRRPGSDMCMERDGRAPEDWLYPDVANERDWTHANSVTVDEANNTLIVSLRNLDAVLGLRYRADGDGAAGALLWELGPNGDLAMQGDGLFQYHQHAAKLRDDGTLILFDNGNLRPGNTDSGGSNPPFSRAVIYKIDPGAGTVRQVWEHRDEDPWGGPAFVPMLGNAQPLANGNVLITYGVVADMKQQPLRPHVRVVEVAPDIKGGGRGDKIVSDLLVGGNAGSGWAAYQAQKVPSLYFGS